MAKKRKRKGRIKSRAQRRKFAELLVQGKIKPEVYERWNRAAGGKGARAMTERLCLPDRPRSRHWPGEIESWRATRPIPTAPWERRA